MRREEHFDRPSCSRPQASPSSVCSCRIPTPCRQGPLLRPEIVNQLAGKWEEMTCTFLTPSTQSSKEGFFWTIVLISASCSFVNPLNLQVEVSVPHQSSVFKEIQSQSSLLRFISWWVGRSSPGRHLCFGLCRTNVCGKNCFQWRNNSHLLATKFNSQYLVVLEERDGHEEKGCDEAEQPLLVLSKPTKFNQQLFNVLLFSRLPLQLGALLQLQIFRFVHFCAHCSPRRVCIKLMLGVQIVQTVTSRRSHPFCPHVAEQATLFLSIQFQKIIFLPISFFERLILIKSKLRWSTEQYLPTDNK